MRSNFKIRDLVTVSLGTVFLAVCSWATVFPALAFRITMQTFGIFLLFFLFGAKKTTVSILIYIALGAIGVPVFSGFGAGVGTLVGPMGGYIFGFVATGLVYFAAESFFAKRKQPMRFRPVIAFLSLLPCYAIGVSWLGISAASFVEAPSVWDVLVFGALIYIPFDIIKIVLAYEVSKKLSRVI